ncbi:MAG TPA: hypothetical protein VFV34_02330 [Blastocatellia bacterium]|nr:hypothetical protein [Blastocatellia bacterium]
MKCPGFNQLIDYLDGRLAGDRAGSVAAHLDSGCAHCSADREWYLRVAAITAGDQSIVPPAWVTKRAIRLFGQKGERRGLVSKLGEAIASLMFDSLARPVAVGVRSAQPLNRQLLYKAGDYSIDLLINLSGESEAELMGQVLREGDFEFECVTGLSLQLLQDGKTVCSAETNHVGEFSISGVDQGDYDLRVETAEVSITIQSLPVLIS